VVWRSDFEDFLDSLINHVFTHIHYDYLLTLAHIIRLFDKS